MRSPALAYIAVPFAAAVSQFHDLTYGAFRLGPKVPTDFRVAMGSHTKADRRISDVSEDRIGHTSEIPEVASLWSYSS
jgi:hypothetical protein